MSKKGFLEYSDVPIISNDNLMPLPQGSIAIRPIDSIEKNDGTYNINFDFQRLENNLSKALDLDIQFCSHCRDLIEIAIVLYYADQYHDYAPGMEEEQDPWAKLWSRELNFRLSISHPEFFSRYIKELVDLAEFVLNEESDFSFFAKKTKFLKEGTYTNGFDRLILVSGGIDSFAAALNYGNSKTIFLSINRGSNRKEQKAVGDFLARAFGDLVHISPLIQSTQAPKITKPELILQHRVRISNIMSRSILYLSYASVIAHHLNIPEILIADNGIVSYNLSVSAGRQHTKTTHPITLFLFQKAIRAIFPSLGLRIINPFIHSTKSEEIGIIKRNNALSAIKSTNSCFNPRKKNMHCGQCYGCLIRRISILATGNAEHDADYAFNAFSPQTKIQRNKPGRRLLIDIILMTKKIRTSSKSELASSYPILFDDRLSYKSLNRVYKLYGRFYKELEKAVQRAGDEQLRKLMRE
ncbi:MAG: 7-cyano-7-deazaguanine synthase [Candidatus Heimdallarchaeota archaeon]